MEKILTVSIAAYNVEKYLANTLESLCVSDVMNSLEVLVIDDGSADSTLSIAKKYEEKYPQTFRAIHKENGGWGSTVNAGLAAARGKYFKLLDGDDEFESQNLADFIKKLSNTNVDFVYTPFLKFEDETNAVLEVCACDKSLGYGVRANVNRISENMPLFMHSCTFRTEVLRKNNVFITEKCFYTDAEYLIKGLACSNTYIMYNDVIYRYRIGRGGQSVSLEGLKKHYKEHRIMLNHVLEFYMKCDTSRRTPIITQLVAGLIHNQYVIYANLGKTDEIKKFDSYICEKYAVFYNRAGKKAAVLRAVDFKIVPLMGAHCKLKNWLGKKHIIKARTAFD